MDTYPEFNSLKLNGNIYHYMKNIFDLYKLYQVLPVVQLPIKCDVKEIPAGSIYSIRSKYGNRGLDGSIWKNSLIIDLKIENRSVNIKINKNYIQTLGASPQVSQDGINMLLTQCMIVKILLSRLNEDSSTLKWVLENTIKDDKLIIPPEYPNDFPENIDKILAKYLINFMADYENHQVEEYHEKINGLLDHANFTDITPEEDHTTYAMVKYHYSVPKKIDCFEFNNILVQEGYKTHYHQAVDNKKLVLEMPFVIPDDIKNEINRKPDKLYHTIEIKLNGNFIQTSPHPILAKKAYNELMELILDVQDSIFLSF